MKAVPRGSSTTQGVSGNRSIVRRKQIMKAISIIGSSGSIGRQTLNVIESMPERFRVVAFASGTNPEELARQIVRHQPCLVSVADSQRAVELRELLRAMPATATYSPNSLPEIQYGSAGLLSVATCAEADV